MATKRKTKTVGGNPYRTGAKGNARPKPKPKYKEPPLDRLAVDRLEAAIRGAADNTRARINEAVEQMQLSGMATDAIRERLQDDLDNGGKITSDLRNFATARVPGWTYDLLTRFGNDTLADFRKREEQRMVDEAKFTEKAYESRKNALTETNIILEESGVDVTQLKDNEFFRPPEDTPLNSKWLWVAVVDNNTCDICEANNGEVKTLQEWIEIGQPRSGVCAGAERCRCVLVPADAAKDEDIPPLSRPRNKS